MSEIKDFRQIYNLLNKKLTQWNRSFHQKLLVTQEVESFLLFMQSESLLQYSKLLCVRQ
jgi:hypothetical protein